MPLAVLPTPAIPDVPRAPGVPTVPSLSTSVGTAILGATAIVSAIQSLLTNDFVWGIYDENDELALTPDTISHLDYRKDFRVPDYPIEEGGFATYNKVATPFENRVVLAKSGTLDERSDLLQVLEDMVASLNLYTIVTPEFTYVDVNLIGLSIYRAPRNVQMLSIELTFTEIRIVEAGQFTESPKDDTAQPAQDQGAVSSTASSTPQTSAAASTVQRQSSATSSSPAARRDADAIMSGVKYRQNHPVTISSPSPGAV